MTSTQFTVSIVAALFGGPTTSVDSRLRGNDVLFFWLLAPGSWILSSDSCLPSSFTIHHSVFIIQPFSNTALSPSMSTWMVESGGKWPSRIWRESGFSISR